LQCAIKGRAKYGPAFYGSLSQYLTPIGWCVHICGLSLHDEQNADDDGEDAHE
jgi:hypothetical protein